MNDRLWQKNVLYEWYAEGLKRKDDYFMRFINHWIALNWLYSKEYEGNPRLTEIEAIRAFCDNQRYMQAFTNYNPFENEHVAVLKKQAIYDMRSGKLATKTWIKLKENDVKALFETLYRIRCNLFHGSKSLRNDRDIELVRASANILEGYLAELVQIVLPE